LANGSRLRIFLSEGSCHQPNEWGLPSEISPKFFDGTQGSRPCTLGKTLCIQGCGYGGVAVEKSFMTAATDHLPAPIWRLSHCLLVANQKDLALRPSLI
jgi:hypothetical protein